MGRCIAYLENIVHAHGNIVFLVSVHPLADLRYAPIGRNQASRENYFKIALLCLFRVGLWVGLAGFEKLAHTPPVRCRRFLKTEGKKNPCPILKTKMRSGKYLTAFG